MNTPSHKVQNGEVVRKTFSEIVNEVLLYSKDVTYFQKMAMYEAASELEQLHARRTAVLEQVMARNKDLELLCALEPRFQVFKVFDWQNPPKHIVRLIVHFSEFNKSTYGSSPQVLTWHPDIGRFVFDNGNTYYGGSEPLYYCEPPVMPKEALTRRK